MPSIPDPISQAKLQVTIAEGEAIVDEIKAEKANQVALVARVAKLKERLTLWNTSWLKLKGGIDNA